MYRCRYRIEFFRASPRDEHLHAFAGETPAKGCAEPLRCAHTYDQS
jgi:hypothetical protein